jgi:DNA-binding CsgD family transcriptional regulator
MLFALIRLTRIAETEGWAQEGLPDARAAGPAYERRVLNALAWARILQGIPIADIEERFPPGEGSPSMYEVSIERVAAVRQGFRGEIAPARAAFTQLLAQAEERGETVSAEIFHLHLCELALRAGDAREASTRLEAWDEWGVIDEFENVRLRSDAALAAITGLPGRTAEAAHQTLSHPAVCAWDRLDIAHAQGLAAIVEGALEEAVERLDSVWQHMQREGVTDPGVFPVAPDLVQTLVDVGRTADAEAVAARLRELATAQEHPWGLLSADRCDASIELSHGYSDEAAAVLARTAAGYGQLGLLFDRARTLLALGSAQRRDRKWGAARSSLEQAEAVFANAGCTGWAERTRSELERVGARRPAAEGELTPAEARVAELAVQGMTNKQIAAALVVSVHTVEVHLSRAYAKLGISSRGQLADVVSKD